MNYKVTFYKDCVELLTERKANFVNKLKALTSRVFEELAQKVGTRGKTNGMAVLEFLKQMAASGKKLWHGAVTLDDYRNLEIEYLPNTGKPIPFKFKFVYDGEGDFTKFSSSGHCLQKIMKGKMFIAEIYLELHFTIGHTDDNLAVKELINTIQHTLVHEIAHAKDESNVEEFKSYKDKSRTSDTDIQYIEYWLKPTEIRSHLNEMIQILSSKRYNNPQRTMKNMQKLAVECGYFPIFRYHPETKEFNLDMTVEHATEGYLIADVLKENNQRGIIGPTLGNKSKYELKEKSFKSGKVLSDAGVSFAIMTDHPVIEQKHTLVQLALFVKEGLDELEALKAVTINAAKLCHIDDKVGSIKEGKDADIVIWDRHPLDIMCKPDVVILNGKVVNQATIMLPFYVKKHYN